MRKFLVVYQANGGAVVGNMFCNKDDNKLMSKQDINECCEYQVNKNGLNKGTVVITGIFEVQAEGERNA